MALLLPIQPGNPNFTIDVDMDGVTYTLQFKWNARAPGWFVSISTSTGEVLVLARRLPVNWPLWWRNRDPLLPSGYLMLNDTTGADLDPGVEDLGARVQVVYVTAAEVAAL